MIVSCIALRSSAKRSGYLFLGSAGCTRFCSVCSINEGPLQRLRRCCLWWQERRRAKDPEYFDRVHGGNPAQAREAAAEEASSNMHKERRKSGDEIFAGDAAGRPNIGT